MSRQFENSLSDSESIILKKFMTKAMYNATTKEFSIMVGEDGELIQPTCVLGSDASQVFFRSVDLYCDRRLLLFGETHNVTSSFLRNSIEFLAKESFEAPHMKVVDNHTVPPMTEKLYDLPKALPEIVVGIMMTDNLIQTKASKSCKSAFPYAYGAREGLPNSIVTGTHLGGISANLEKMQQNQYELHPDITQVDLFCALFMLIHDLGYDPNQLQIELPERELMIDILRQYHTSAAMAPFNNARTMVIDEKGEVKETNKLPRTKSGLAEAIADLIIDYMSRIDQLQDRVFPCSTISPDSVKYEILNGLEAANYEELLKMHEKVRLFFIDPPQDVMLSMIALRGVFDYLNQQGFSIGAILNRGQSFQEWVHHDAGAKLFPNEETKGIYEQYPFLRKRESGEADVAKFDQSLIYKILMMVAIFFCTFYNATSNLTKTILGDMSFRLVFKYLYLKPIQRLFFVSGMMFSGKYETTHGNTAYQNLVFFLYLNHKLRKFKDHKDIAILKLCIKFRLITRSFSGDDFFFSYPIYLKEVFSISLDDYGEFAKKCGLTFKYTKIRKLFATVVSRRAGLGWITVMERPGITFLKNMMAQVYEEDKDGSLVFVGYYPYRSTEDIFFRLGNSDKANRYLDSIFAKILSLAYISFGNREAFTYLQMLYLIMKKKTSWNGKFDFDNLEGMFGSSGVMYMAYQSMKLYGCNFPTLEDLRGAHDLHEKKPKRILRSFNDYKHGLSKSTLVEIDF